MWASRRCTPATPTSKRRVTRQPMTSAHTAASSATGMSAVPPVATTTWPSRGGSARRSTTMTRAASCHTASGRHAARAAERARARRAWRARRRRARGSRRRSPRPARRSCPGRRSPRESRCARRDGGRRAPRWCRAPTRPRPRRRAAIASSCAASSGESGPGGHGGEQVDEVLLVQWRLPVGHGRVRRTPSEHAAGARLYSYQPTATGA